jgi:predicted nucleic acid-binding protein
MQVVSDTGPLNYLVQIDAIEILQSLFGTIVVPEAVRDELSHPRAPATVRAWIEGVRLGLRSSRI